MRAKRAKELRRRAVLLAGSDPGERPFRDRFGTWYGPRWRRLYRGMKRHVARGGTA